MEKSENLMNYLFFTTPKDYHKEYYKKNRDILKYKRELIKATKITDEVMDWKKNKEADPYALYPFYEGSRGVPDISANGIPASSAT